MPLGIGADLRFAARRLIAAPVFTLFAVISLALGLGITVAVYSVVDTVLVRDAGVREPDRVAFVVNGTSWRVEVAFWSDADFEDLRATQHSFQALAASLDIHPSVIYPSSTDRVLGEAVSAHYFPTFGVGAAVGRLLVESDERQAASVAVISHRTWTTRFGSDPQIAGKTLRLPGAILEIVGVANEQFEGPRGRFSHTAVWVPLSTWRLIAAGREISPDRDQPRLMVAGRLRPNVTIDAVSSELTRLGAAVDAQRPRRASGRAEKPRRTWRARSVSDVAYDQDLPLRRLGYVVIGLVALVLVVACTNLSNLVLARGAARRQDLAVRRALGASRARLVREQLAESGLLALAGGAGAVSVIFTLPLLWTGEIPIAPELPIPMTPTVNGAVMAVAVTAVVLSLLVFGLEPAIQLTRAQDVRGELAVVGGGVVTPRTRRHRLLLRWQVAVSAAFFIIATMCIRHTISEARHDPGVDLDRLAIARIDFGTLQWHQEGLPTLNWNEGHVRRTVDRLIEELGKERAVAAASVSTGLPFGTPAEPLLVNLERPDEAGEGRVSTTAIAATPSIFRTLGVSIVMGRGFDARDVMVANPVIVLSERTARAVFGTKDAVGRQLNLKVPPGGPARADSQVVTVIGVARDTDVGQISMRGDLVYMPLDQHPAWRVRVTARARGEAQYAVTAIRAAARRVDPELTIDNAAPARFALAPSSVFLRKMGIFALSLGGVTLLLAMVGLYGVQSHAVAQRIREMGIRMSLGATTSSVKRMVLREGYRPVVEGLLIGLILGSAGRMIVRSFVVTTVSVIDPWMFALVPIPIMLAAFFACYLPARRAARLDPNVALRNL